jgi:hypothetical protein
LRWRNSERIRKRSPITPWSGKLFFIRDEFSIFCNQGQSLKDVLLKDVFIKDVFVVIS